MVTEMVAPSQLHKQLQRARDTGEDRKDTLASTLESKNMAVIRRIPECLAPLSDEEKEMIAQWAENLAQAKNEEENVSNRDFAFHLMANCGVPGERILGILERHKTFSRSALEHIQKVLGGDETAQKLDDYLFEVAEKLLTQERIPSRDRGRHMLITLACTSDQWVLLACRFSMREISDLRQRVIERFVRECPDGEGLSMFCRNVVEMCLQSIRNAAKQDVHKEASHMHWVLTCLKREDKQEEIVNFNALLINKFSLQALPRSVRGRVESLLMPKAPDMNDLLEEGMAWLRADEDRCNAIFTPTSAQAPTYITKPVSTETNAQIAARLGISKRQAAKLRQEGKL
jgi:hypothetical protein